jgi:hypothetical protein
MLFKVYNFNGERVRITKRLSCRRIQCGWVSVIYTDAIEDGDTVQIDRPGRANVFVAHTVHRLIDNLPWLICVHGVSIASTDPTTVVAFGGVGSETHLVTVRAGHMMMTEDANGDCMYYVVSEQGVDEVAPDMLDYYDAIRPGRPLPHWERIFDFRVEDAVEDATE